MKKLIFSIRKHREPFIEFVILFVEWIILTGIIYYAFPSLREGMEDAFSRIPFAERKPPSFEGASIVIIRERTEEEKALRKFLYDFLWISTVLLSASLVAMYVRSYLLYLWEGATVYLAIKANSDLTFFGPLHGISVYYTLIVFIFVRMFQSAYVIYTTRSLYRRLVFMIIFVLYAFQSVNTLPCRPWHECGDTVCSFLSSEEPPPVDFGQFPDALPTGATYCVHGRWSHDPARIAPPRPCNPDHECGPHACYTENPGQLTECPRNEPRFTAPVSYCDQGYCRSILQPTDAGPDFDSPLWGTAFRPWPIGVVLPPIVEAVTHYALPNQSAVQSFKRYSYDELDKMHSPSLKCMNIRITRESMASGIHMRGYIPAQLDNRTVSPVLWQRHQPFLPTLALTFAVEALDHPIKIEWAIHLPNSHKFHHGDGVHMTTENSFNERAETSEKWHSCLNTRTWGEYTRDYGYGYYWHATCASMVPQEAMGRYYLTLELTKPGNFPVEADKGVPYELQLFISEKT